MAFLKKSLELCSETYNCSDRCRCHDNVMPTDSEKNIYTRSRNHSLTNSDYEKYKYHIASFKKGLKQKVSDRSIGMQSLEKFHKGLMTKDIIMINSSCKFNTIDPLSPYSVPDEYRRFLTKTVKPHTYESPEFATDMLEVYLMYLMRDVNFIDWSDESSNLAYNLYNEFIQANPTHNLLGESVSDSKGYVVSQFLLQDIPVWGIGKKKQQIAYYTKNKDSLTNVADYENQHFNGILPVVPVSGQINTDGLDGATLYRYCVRGRDLAAYVNNDSPTQFIDSASAILFSGFKQHLKTPFAGTMISGFNDFGAPCVFKLLRDASLMALKCSFYHKFFLHQVLRPEEFGYNIENEYGTLNSVFINSPILNAIKKKNDTRLLPVAYPEGSPAHPSYPAGHAVIAGAGITILKAFFNEAGLMNDMRPTHNGLDLLSQHEGTDTVTIGDELNKLASNIGFGRGWAGIHYRMDSMFGIKLGEDVAISVLQHYKSSLPYHHTFSFSRYDGTHVVI